MTYFELIHHFAIVIIGIAVLYNNRCMSRIEKRFHERLQYLEYVESNK